MNYGDHKFIEITQQSCKSLSSCGASRTSRARRVKRVDLCSSTMSTQPKCMGSTRRTCRVVSSQVEFGYSGMTSALLLSSFPSAWIPLQNYPKHRKILLFPSFIFFSGFQIKMLSFTILPNVAASNSNWWRHKFGHAHIFLPTSSASFVLKYDEKSSLINGFE